jgi:hypothetical protein
METKPEETTAIVKVDNQIQRIEIPADAPLMIRLAMMIENRVPIDVEQMRAMQEMGEQFEANEARKAYATAFADAQSDIGGVVKKRKNAQTNSMYAGLDDVIEMSKAACTKHNFSVTFYEGTTEAASHIRVCAVVLHKDGHKEAYHYDVPLGGVGIQGKVNMTAIHAKATSVSYGQRYLLCMIWNIPTKDNDGNNGTQVPPPARAFVPLTSAEFEVIDAILDKLPGKEGFKLNKGRITAMLSERSRQYILLEHVDFLAEQVMTKCGDHDLYEIDNSTPNEQEAAFEPQDS